LQRLQGEGFHFARGRPGLIQHAAQMMESQADHHRTDRSEVFARQGEKRPLAIRKSFASKLSLLDELGEAAKPEGQA